MASRLARWALWLLPFALLGCEDWFVRRSPGEKLYREMCARCHGYDGKGNTVEYLSNANADLTQDSARYGTDREAMAQVIREGVFGSMPAHPELKDREIKELLDHIAALRRHGQGTS